MDYEDINTYQPYSLEAEQSVIGGLLIDNYKLPDVVELITSNDFYLEKHKTIFRAIEVIHEKGQPVDVTMVISELSTAKAMESVGGIGYLAELAHNTPDGTNVMAYTQRVRDKRKERDVLSMASQMVCEIQNDDGTSQERINNALSVISDFDHEDKIELTYDEQHKEFIRDFKRRADAGGELTGIPTGFIDIDRRFNGLQKTDLIIVAARPAMGKTTYAMNIAHEIAKEKPVLIFSMEMSAEQLIGKMYSRGGILMNNLKSGELEDREYAIMMDIGYRQKQLKLTIDDRAALKPQQVRAKALKVKRKYGEIGLIVVDYLQLMTTNGSDGRTNEITKISGALKALAKEINCPVIALSQLNRDVEKRTNKRPVMSDLRDSGAIEQDADIIQFIYRDDYYAGIENRESKAPGIAEINTAKFRSGETGPDYLKSELHYSRFVNLIEPYQPYQEEHEDQKKEYKGKNNFKY